MTTTPMMQIEGVAFRLLAVGVSTDFRVVTPDYFRVMGVDSKRAGYSRMRIRKGAPLVALVMKVWLNNHWPHQDPVGKRVRPARRTPEKATPRT